MSRGIFPNLKLLTGATANGVSVNPISVGDYRHITVAVTVSAGFVSGTLKFNGSEGLMPAAFGSAASASNQYAPVAAKNLNDTTTVTGSTGISLAAAGTFLFEINTNGLMWLSTELAGITGSGTVDVVATGFSSDN